MKLERSAFVRWVATLAFGVIKSDDWEDFNFTLVEPYDLWYVSNVNLDWVVTIYVAWCVHMVPILFRI